MFYEVAFCYWREDVVINTMPLSYCHNHGLQRLELLSNTGSTIFSLLTKLSQKSFIRSERIENIF